LGKRALLKIIQYQEKKVRLYKKILKRPFPGKYTMGLIFDDVTSKRQFRKGEILEDLFSNGRHYKSIIIISCQYIKQLPPAVRTNTDFLFLLHNTKRTCKILYEEYVENPDEFSMFLDLLKTVTSQRDIHGKDMFNSLVYNNCVKTYKLDVMFQVYRHTENFSVEDVHLGSTHWRDYNARYYKDREFEDQKKSYRKSVRLKRLKAYREKVRLKRDSFNIQGIAMDLDYFSDSSESDTKLDKYQIRGRRGKSVNIHMQNRHRQVTSSSSSSSSSSSHLPLPLCNETRYSPSLLSQNDVPPGTVSPNQSTVSYVQNQYYSSLDQPSNHSRSHLSNVKTRSKSSNTAQSQLSNVRTRSQSHISKSRTRNQSSNLSKGRRTRVQSSNHPRSNISKDQSSNPPRHYRSHLSTDRPRDPSSNPPRHSRSHLSKDRPRDLSSNPPRHQINSDRYKSTSNSHVSNDYQFFPQPSTSSKILSPPTWNQEREFIKNHSRNVSDQVSLRDLF
jgi:hypothetical protein